MVVILSFHQAAVTQIQAPLTARDRRREVVTSSVTTAGQWIYHHAVGKAQWTAWWCLHSFTRRQCVETHPYPFNMVKQTPRSGLSSMISMCGCEGSSFQSVRVLSYFLFHTCLRSNCAPYICIVCGAFGVVSTEDRNFMLLYFEYWIFSSPRCWFDHSVLV